MGVLISWVSNGWLSGVHSHGHASAKGVGITHFYGTRNGV